MQRKPSSLRKVLVRSQWSVRQLKPASAKAPACTTSRASGQQAALVEEYAAHLSSEPARHEALFDGPPEETLVPGFIEWFRSFDHDNHGWSTVGLAIHSNFVHDEELMRPVKLWYERLHARIAALPEDVRTPALVAIMAIEGFFYSHKFEVDLVSPKLKIQAWHFILENLVHNHAAAQTKH